MTKAKAVEPYTDEEKERHSPIANDEGGKALLELLRDANSCTWEATAENLEATQFNIDRLLATIEADREKLEHAGEQFALLSASTGRALKDLLERAEAAEARVSELEKEREWRDMETCPDYDPRCHENIWVLWPPGARREDRRVELRLPDRGFWQHVHEKHNAPLPMGWMPHWKPTPPEEEAK